VYNDDAGRHIFASEVTPFSNAIEGAPLLGNLAKAVVSINDVRS